MMLQLGAGASLLMVGLWLFQLLRRNATIVDVGWAVGMVAAAVLFALWGEGNGGRRLLVAALAGIWALRLVWHLTSDRIVRAWTIEDGRYANMRRALGRLAQPGFFAFFQLQAGFVLVFALPLLPAVGATRDLDLLDVLGLLIGCGAVVGEWTADRQLLAFKRDAANRHRTCRRGLWRYSRHPNYFFEWLFWLAWPLIACGAANWWLALSGPLSMYLFVVYLTGIPHSERQAASHRPDYGDYQRTTNRLFPWQPRRGR
jgi:steroid 5-alpha reductase family enzyme